MVNDLKILKESNGWLAIDKPANLVVHDVPGRKHRGNTVVDWLIQQYPDIQNLDWPDQTRPGIVHRLDQDTSGVMLLAKNPQALKTLQNQFRNHMVSKIYTALVLGKVPEKGILSGKISRKKNTQHKVSYLTFPWQKSKAKTATTSFQNLHTYPLALDKCGGNTSPLALDKCGGEGAVSLIKLQPKTGRTHQLRVQLLDAGWPIIGDKFYNTKQSKQLSQQLGLNRQFLHASRLEFVDPNNQNNLVVVKSQLADDLKHILAKLLSRGN